MLDFIVLGLVPGTGIQLTFVDVLRLECIVILLVLLAWELRHSKQHKPFSAHMGIDDISL